MNGRREVTLFIETTAVAKEVSWSNSHPGGGGDRSCGSTTICGTCVHVLCTCGFSEARVVSHVSFRSFSKNARIFGIFKSLWIWLFLTNQTNSVMIQSILFCNLTGERRCVFAAVDQANSGRSINLYSNSFLPR